MYVHLQVISANLYRTFLQDKNVLSVRLILTPVNLVQCVVYGAVPRTHTKCTHMTINQKRYIYVLVRVHAPLV